MDSYTYIYRERKRRDLEQTRQLKSLAPLCAFVAGSRTFDLSIVPVSSRLYSNRVVIES